MSTIAEWIAYLEIGLPQFPDPEDAENFLHEQIDKAHRRGLLSETNVFCLQMHFGLVE